MMTRAIKHDERETAEAEAWLDGLDPDSMVAEDISDLQDIAAAVDESTAADAHIRRAVLHARANGRSWGRIGTALGVSRQAARERFGERAAA